MTTHPEVPQATAREEARALAVELGRAAKLCDRHGDAWCSCKVGWFFDALLSPRTVPYETCGGEGYELVESTLPTADIAKACPDCSDGSVTLGPLAVLVGELEQVALGIEHEGEVVDVMMDPPPGLKPLPGFTEIPLFRAPFIEAQREEA